MKNLLLILFFIYLLTSFVKSNELNPLSKYSDENNNKSNKFSYDFHSRCTALFIYSSNLMKDPKMKEMKEEFYTVGSVFYKKASAIAGALHDNKGWEEELKKKISLFIDIYTDLGIKNYKKNKEYLTKLHFSDIEVCSDFYKKKLL